MTRALLLSLALAPALAAAAPRASSELRTADGVRHTAALAFDGLLQTGWAEGDTGPGAGAWIELPLQRATEVHSVSIWPGNLSQGRRSLREHGRPRVLQVVLVAADGSEVEKTVTLEDVTKTGPQRIDVEFEEPVEARSVKVIVAEAFEGGVFNDTYLAEVGVNFSSGESGRAAERLVEWQGSDESVRLYQSNKEEIVGLFDTISGAQFGDADALGELMDRAADGAPYLRGRALRYVSDGYRVQALPPDDVAVSALLKLKDANAIPALEMAALRLTGREAAELEEKVEMFYAYQELIGGGDPNISYWGQEGWELGALRSFGEPLGVEMTVFGEVLVADLANHRIQRFNPEGRADRVWGGEAGITDVWLGGDRPWYVAGSEPGTEPGRFTLPVDIEVIPGKESYRFAVLDAEGRVQLFDEDGNVTLGWEVLTDHDLTAGVGGEGYLEYHRGKLVVIWQDNVWVYNLEAEELASFKIEDGRPNGAEMLRNGKLALIFGDKLIEYSLDGFRHGALLGDELGHGFEDWDVTLDEDGRLWVITDAGLAVKYKKPGRVDFTVQVSDFSLQSPRLAVYDDLLYIVERDRILKVDALELLAEAEAAEAEAAEAE